MSGPQAQELVPGSVGAFLRRGDVGERWLLLVSSGEELLEHTVTLRRDPLLLRESRLSLLACHCSSVLVGGH